MFDLVISILPLRRGAALRLPSPRLSRARDGLPPPGLLRGAVPLGAHDERAEGHVGDDVHLCRL